MFLFHDSWKKRKKNKLKIAIAGAIRNVENNEVGEQALFVGLQNSWKRL